MIRLINILSRGIFIYLGIILINYGIGFQLTIYILFTITFLKLIEIQRKIK